MLPGKKFKLDDALRIAWRRKWWVLVPLLIFSIGTPLVARLIPDRYRSEAVILIVPQRVPESYVRSTVTTLIADRVRTISQQIMSRARLEGIIQDFDLYPEQRRTGIMEDVVETMRRNIRVDIPRSSGRRDASSSFQVSFTSTDPRTAMRVTDRLAYLFIDENLRDREVLAEGTDQFLETQLNEARRQLQEHEQALEAYRLRFSGQLPSQLDSNIQVLQSTQAQLQAVDEAISRDRDRLIALDGMIADTEALPVTSSFAVDGATDVPPLTTAEALEAARNQLRLAEVRFKPEHPDLIRLERHIEDLERKVEAEALARPVSPAAVPMESMTAAERAQQTRLSELRAEKDQIAARLASQQEDRTRLEQMAVSYRQRIEAAPSRESELVALTRDYDTLRQRYAQLLSKREDAKIAADLERRQIGEQFRIIEPARIPSRPVSPNRSQINLFGVLMGLGIGVALVAWLEYRDLSLRNDDDIALVLQLPVLATVPVIQTAADRHRRRLRALSATAALTLLVGAAAVVWRVVF